MDLITDWKLALSVDDVLRGQGADPQVVHASKPLLMKSAQRAFSEGINLIHPITLSMKIAVNGHFHNRITLANGNSITGPLVTRLFGGAQRMVAAICTIGPALEETSAELFNKDPIYALAIDGLGNAAVDSLAQQLCNTIAVQAKQEGLQVSTPLSPGLPEWPVEIGQPQIFALLDSARAGIKLTSGSMMHPKKSVSFILGIGQEISQTSMCLLCSLKNTCRYQNDRILSN